jgi:hypothetical protein
MEVILIGLMKEASRWSVLTVFSGIRCHSIAGLALCLHKGVWVADVSLEIDKKNAEQKA